VWERVRVWVRVQWDDDGNVVVAAVDRVGCDRGREAGWRVLVRPCARPDDDVVVAFVVGGSAGGPVRAHW